MKKLAEICRALPEPDGRLLQDIALGMPIAADLSRSDFLLICPLSDAEMVVVAQARPHSISSLYEASLVGRTLTRNETPMIMDAWRRARHQRVQRELIPSGAPVVQDVYPIRGHDGRPLALLNVETSLIQLERHRHRHRSFRQAVEWVKAMCMRGELADAATLSPFGEWDGVLFVDAQRRIRYLSGIANNLYRRLGYMEDLRRRRLPTLNTGDDEMVLAAMASRKPLEREVQENAYTWVRKVLPVWPSPTLAGWLQGLASWRSRPGEVGGVLIMVHDATEERRKKQELDVKATMIQEVHHRVKNNLQAIAAMLRMQARRTGTPETLQAIKEAISRILSVALIHEYLSHSDWQTINVRDVCQRIVNQSSVVASAPDRQITFSVEGPAVYLASQQATAFALAMNELIQNAIEHGFEKEREGHVWVRLEDGGDQVKVEIRDDGDLLPAGFDLGSSSNLGLQIVQTLVHGDLHGRVQLANQGDQVVATVVFPKPPLPSDMSQSNQA